MFYLLLLLGSVTAREGRYAFGLPIGQSVSATFTEGSATCGAVLPAPGVGPGLAGVGATCTVRGRVTFRQNFLTGADADYEVWLTGSGILPRTQYIVGFSTDCSLPILLPAPLTVPYQMQWQQLNNAVMSPFLMVNGFYIKGTSGVYNINGASGRFPLRGSNTFFVVARTDRTIIGCSTAVLA